MLSLEFFITSLIVVLIPGTGVIYTISLGLFMGGRASILAALGCTAGIIPHLLATILGLAALLHVSAVAFQVVKFVGVAYLFFLAFLPQFVPANVQAPVVNMVVLSVSFMAMTLVVFICYGLFANSLRGHILQSPKIVKMTQRSFARIFAGLGVKLAFTDH